MGDGKRPDTRRPLIMGVTEGGEYVPIQATSDGGLQTAIDESTAGLPATGFENIEVSDSSAVGLGMEADQALIDVEGGDVIVRFDGGSPEEDGHILQDGSAMNIEHPENVDNFLVIAVDGDSAELKVTYFGGDG